MINQKMPTEQELTIGVVQFCCIERIKLCSDFSYIDPLGRNLLFHAAKRTLEIFSFVLSKGLDLTKVNSLDETCLTEACKCNNLPVVEYILTQKKSTSMDLDSPLKWACIVENYSMISILLEKGANVNDSLLNLCIGKSRISIVRKLLQYGANPNSGLSEGHTPYTISIGYNRLDMVILLRIYGAKHNTLLRNYVWEKLTRDPDYNSTYSFYNASSNWTSLETALASRSITDTRFLIENRKVDLKLYCCHQLLEFIKKENLYLNQPKISTALYNYIKKCYLGWSKEIHKYYSKNFRQNIRLILSRRSKMLYSIPEELWLLIFNFILIE